MRRCHLVIALGPTFSWLRRDARSVLLHFFTFALLPFFKLILLLINTVRGTALCVLSWPAQKAKRQVDVATTSN